MVQAMALQVKAEHDIASCQAAAAEASQKLRIAQQEAAEAAEAAWRREMADHEAAVRQEQAALQAEQVDMSFAIFRAAQPSRIVSNHVMAVAALSGGIHLIIWCFLQFHAARKLKSCAALVTEML